MRIRRWMHGFGLWMLLLVSPLLMSCGTASTMQAPPPPAPMTPEAVVRDVFAALDRGNAEEIAGWFDPTNPSTPIEWASALLIVWERRNFDLPCDDTWAGGYEDVEGQ